MHTNPLGEKDPGWNIHNFLLYLFISLSFGQKR
jgi:hypothetical protein